MVAVPSRGRAAEVTPRCAAPEADAARELYERYARQIYAYCQHQLGNREEAEDATQSTFLNAFRGFKRGVDPEFESAWLYKIAHNVCLTRRRSTTRRRRVESPGDLDAMQDILPSHESDADELIGLPEALHGLPTQQRRALLLREWQGLSYKEIGVELALSQAAVETLLFRARRSLAGKLRAGTDAGSVVALVKTFFTFGGAKVAATVVAVAAGSVVAAPIARQELERVVAPAQPVSASPARPSQTVGVVQDAPTARVGSLPAAGGPRLRRSSPARIPPAVPVAGRTALRPAALGRAPRAAGVATLRAAREARADPAGAEAAAAPVAPVPVAPRPVAPVPPPARSLQPSLDQPPPAATPDGASAAESSDAPESGGTHGAGAPQPPASGAPPAQAVREAARESRVQAKRNGATQGQAASAGLASASAAPTLPASAAGPAVVAPAATTPPAVPAVSDGRTRESGDDDGGGRGK